MFHYQDTGKLSKPKESQRKVVTEVRKVTYLNNLPDEEIKELIKLGQPVLPVTTVGYETVKEMVVSPEFCDIIPKVVETKTVDARWVVKRVKKKDKKKLFMIEPDYNDKGEYGE